MDFEQARMQMVERQIMPRGISSPAVLAAMRKVPRHRFVSAEFHDSAYGDYPLPIDDGQTISQPYMVALMTELLDIQADSVVLEIGTGSGYQTAILAELARQVYTVERLASLAEQAQRIFQELQYENIQAHVGDGTLGWAEHAPYSRIIVTAGAPAVPETLLAQLADQGKLVIPVGNRVSQILKVMTKHGDRFETDTSCHCVFVKLIGQHGWEQ